MEPAQSESLTAALGPVLDELLTPALIIDLDAVAHNLAAVIARVGGPQRWQPHLKTSKQAVVISLMLEAGLRHFKVATADELALLLRTADEAGVEGVEVLFAYPASRAALRAVLSLAGDRTARVCVLADSRAHLEQLVRDATELGWRRQLPIMLDVDLGMRRTGSMPEHWQSLRELPAPLALAGLHGYDGHLRWEQRAEAHAGYDRLCALASSLAEQLHIDPSTIELITSGTHSYAHALAHAGLSQGPWQHRVSPGTIVLSDLRSHAAAADIGLRQAAFVATRVVSVGPGRVTCDAGSKAITPDGAPPTCVVLDHPELTPLRASEEHLPCELAEQAATPALGQLLWLIPDHVCTTVNLHREAVWLRAGRFAGFGPVAASGHRPRAPLCQTTAGGEGPPAGLCPDGERDRLRYRLRSLSQT
ncbi:MAG TPA: alanine racemase [Enhygromyxa sp.]|nr:alanine racemase [Enhygromyxa sp.]